MNEETLALEERGPLRTLLDRCLHRAGAGVAWVVLHPVRVPPVPTPRVLGLSYHRVRLQSAGAELAAWHIPREGSRAGIVLCHGHNNCRNQFLPLLRPLHQAGFHLFLFDFRSMGISGGRLCTYGYEERRDVLTAVEWLRREAGLERIGLFGFSMGAATVLLAAAEDPEIQAVVTDCAFARLEDMVEQNFYYLPRPLRGPVGRSVRHWTEQWCGRVIQEVDPEAALRQWRPRPLLLIHGERDRLIPVEHARRLATVAGEQAELWIVPRAPHVGCRAKAGRQYVERVTTFFRIHLGG